jgi:hypothetical protein
MSVRKRYDPGEFPGQATKKISGVLMVGTSVCPAIPPLVLRVVVMKYLF